MKSVLVTGYAGFIGSNLVRQLLAIGYSVVGIDNFSANYSTKHQQNNIADFSRHKYFTPYKGDVRGRYDTQLRHIMSNHELQCVVHLAALTGVRESVKQPAHYWDVNVMGTLNILQRLVCNQSCNAHFILASTSSVYESRGWASDETDLCNTPRTPYAASKLAAELMAYNYHYLHQLPVTVLRFFTAYGPGNRPDMMAFKLAEAWRTSTPVVLYDNVQRDWTFVDDIVQGIIAAIEYNAPEYEVINLGSGTQVKLTDFVHVMEQTAPDCRRIVADNEPCPPTDALITHADITKAKKLLKYKPTTTIEQGIPLFWEWYQNQLELTRA